MNLRKLKTIGTAYLLTPIENADGTIVSDHPCYILGYEDYYILFMIVTRMTKEFSVFDEEKQEAIQFVACSDFRNEIERSRGLHGDVYIVNKDDVEFSRYRFKRFDYNVGATEAILKSLQLKVDGLGGFKKIVKDEEFDYDDETIYQTLEVKMNSLHDAFKSRKQIKFTDIPLVRYERRKTISNINTYKDHNISIYQTRKKED